MFKLRHTAKIALSALVMMAASQSHAQTTLLHYWSFNNVTTAYHNPGIPPFHATFSVIDTNVANVVYHLDPGTSSTYAGYIDNLTPGDTTNARLGTAAGNAMRVRNPSDSMDLRVFAPTTGYHGYVTIKYEVEASSTTSGQLAQLFDYSTDSGTTWKTSGLNMTIDSISQAQFQGTNWGLIKLIFNDTTTENNARFVFRIKFAGNTSLTSGNNRFDNMTVESTVGTPPNTTGVSTVANQISDFSMYPNPASNQLNVESQAGVSKTVTIYNVSGQRMTAVQSEDKNITVNISAIPAGTYYVYVTSGAHTQVKTFVKQ